MTTTTVELGGSLRKFVMGNACGAKVREAHAPIEFESHEQRLALFWFSAGMLGAGEYGLDSVNEPEFVAGLALHAPSITDADDDDDEPAPPGVE